MKRIQIPALILAIATACAAADPPTGPVPDGPAPHRPQIAGLWLVEVVWTQDLCKPLRPPVRTEVEIEQSGNTIVFSGAFVEEPLRGTLEPDGSLRLDRDTSSSSTTFAGQVDRDLDDDQIVGSEEQRNVMGDEICLLNRTWTMSRASEFGL